MATVTFLPSGAQVPAHVGETLFEIGARASAGIQTSCVGKGTCGLCRVKVVDGAAGLSDYTEAETKHLGNLYHISRVRLSCRTHLASDVDVTLEVKTPPKRAR